MKKLLKLSFLLFLNSDLISQTISLTYDAFGNRLTKTIAATKPKISITGDSLVCQGDSIRLSAIGGANYQWNNGKTGSTISVIADSSRTYTVTAYATTVCSTSAYRRVAVTPVPVTGPIIGDTVGIFNTTNTYSVPYHAGSFYSWAVNGGNVIISGYGTNKVTIQWDKWNNLSFPFAIISVFEKVNNSPCVSDSVKKLIRLAARIPASELGISVYPNPSRNNTVAKVVLTRPGSITVIIYNILGQLIGQKSFTTGQSSYEIHVNQICLLPSGMYYMKIQHDDNEEIRKFKIIN